MKIAIDTNNPLEYARAELLLEHIAKNMEIEFKLNPANWERDDFQRSFQRRASLLIARDVLCEIGEQLCNTQAKAKKGGKGE